MYSLYLVVLSYCHFIWFYLTCLNEINGDGEKGELTSWIVVARRPGEWLDTLAEIRSDAAAAVGAFRVTDSCHNHTAI